LKKKEQWRGEGGGGRNLVVDIKDARSKLSVIIWTKRAILRRRKTSRRSRVDADLVFTSDVLERSSTRKKENITRRISEGARSIAKKAKI